MLQIIIWITTRSSYDRIIYSNTFYLEPSYHIIIFLYYVFARDGGAILHDDDLKVLDRLLTKTFKEFVRFVGTVIYGYDDGYFHILLGGKGTAFFD